MFTPDSVLLKKYADLLVKYALNSGQGIKPGEVVQCVVPDLAKPLLIELHRSILEAGGHPMVRLLPTGIEHTFYELANDDQLTFFPKKLIKTRIDTIDHTIGIIAEHNLKELADIDPKKIMKAQEANSKARDWMTDKEYSGNLTWTIALYPTEAEAKEAGLSIEEYWEEIVHACYLDEPDPIKVWQGIQHEQERLKSVLNALKTEKLHIVAPETDLWITMGEHRQWVGGGGRNIPSFEIFTSPDWRGTEGTISFNQPLYRYGNIMEGIHLTFHEGKVVKAEASKNESLLKQMISRPNADKVGEFSLTDSRLSRINHFMADTLFDENRGGEFGNTHIAVGMSYKDAYDGDIKSVKKSEWAAMGFNNSGEHCDIVSTTDRTVTSYASDGSEKVIFADGKFQI